MALKDDYNAAVENPEFRQKVAIAVTRAIMDAVAATTPPASHLALAKRFLLAPAAEIERYLLPIAARIAINAGSFTSDANIQTAANQVLLVNVQLAIT